MPEKKSPDETSPEQGAEQSEKPQDSAPAPEEQKQEQEEQEQGDTDKAAAGSEKAAEEETSVADSSFDPYYPPIITLPEVIVNSGEEEEDELLNLRAKLYRYTANDEDETAEWKERGTGHVKLLKHRDTGSIRVLMRRDKTLKVCANHSVQPWMALSASVGSDRAFVWRVQADYADGVDEGRHEIFAIRFSNTDIAKKFKTAFERAVWDVTSLKAKQIKDEREKSLCDQLGKVEIASAEADKEDEAEK